MAKKRPKSRTTKQVEPPTVPKVNSANEPPKDDKIAAAISAMPQGVLMKVCRLCETKDGPFLNIFDADKVTAKKIEEVMPFGIAENDDLPHKICFRCSAKVEELFEFVQKCIKTQESLRTAKGKKGSLVFKTKTCELWKQKLNKTNLSNEDICDALIKKAMEGIQNIPLKPVEKEKSQPPTNKKNKANTESPVTSKKEKEPAAMSSKSNVSYQSDEDEPDDISLKQVKLTIAKCNQNAPVTRATRSNKSETQPNIPETLPEPTRKTPSRKTQSKLEAKSVVENKSTKDAKQTDNPNSNVVKDDKSKDESESEKPKEEPAKVEITPPPINIMDHVSTIKVHGVGTLFLCKLCNRNFLKKEVVMTHGCARNNVPKDSFLKSHVPPPPEIPKPPTVKYIKMDKDFKKPVVSENKPAEKKPVPTDCIRVNIPVQSASQVKPKAGPANRIKEVLPESPKEVTLPPAASTVANVTQQEKPVVPSVQFPGLPCLNSRYKLVPGPNNTFTLIEDGVPQNEKKPTEENIPQVTPPTKCKKRKNNTTTLTNPNNQEQDVGAKSLGSHVTEKAPSPDVIDLDDIVPPQPPPIIEQPYPVGLFQTVPHHSGVFAPNTHPTPAAFTTPAMKKQSYTIVQTGNPSKLLISTKPQPVVEEPSRKKSRKSKPEVRDVSKEPFSVTIEDNGPPKDAETGFFTFINVDPLLQPSYVLPTDNIIQESQITTSTPPSKGILDNNKDKDKYSCNMCDEKFSREKKLLAHIQSHYNQMDEEDQLRAEKTGTKRKSRKS